MAQSPLHSARQKLGRAEELLNEVSSAYDKLNAESEAQRSEIPVPNVEHNLITGRMWYVMTLPFVPPEPDERWGLLVGDAMHNTRSALDHLACRLVEHNGKRPSIRTAFPIWSTAPADKDERKRYRSRVAGMSALHKKGIRLLQPFSNPGTPEASKLEALSALDNLDKHQILLPLAVTIRGDEVRPPLIGAENHVEFDYEWNGGQLAYQGVELLRFSPRGPIGKIHSVNIDIRLRTTFGDTSTGLSELRAIRDHVVGIVESFAPELG